MPTTAISNWEQHRAELLGQTPDLKLPAQLKLPILPLAVQNFSVASQNSEVRVDQLAKILETDSGLTAEILALVNSSLFGLRSQAANVKHALSLLGVKRARTFVLTTGVKRAMGNTTSKLINLKNFWACNLERAIFAKLVARQLKVDEETAFSASMLQDFLLPALTSAFFEQYTKFVDHQGTAPTMLASFEQNEFHWDHAVAAAHVVNTWGFPAELTCCLYLHHQGLKLFVNPSYTQTTAAAVAVASLLPDDFQQSPQGLDQLIQLQSAWRSFQLDELADETEANFQEMGGNQIHHLSLKKRLAKKLAAAN